MLEKKPESFDKYKIFCIYHKPFFKFENKIVTPIQSGAENSEYSLDMLKDNSGDNISCKNKTYAELTVNYWVLNEYLKNHPEVEYVGFCHYRRFLDFKTGWRSRIPRNEDFRIVKPEDFQEKFQKDYGEEKIVRAVKGYDIILPRKFKELAGFSLYEQFVHCHRNSTIDKAIEIIKRDYPAKAPYINALYKKTGYFCLNYVMKRELFEDFIGWVLEFADKLVSESDVEKDFSGQKIPAFIAERFFNVWLLEKISKNKIKLKEYDMILIDEDVNQNKRKQKSLLEKIKNKIRKIKNGK